MTSLPCVVGATYEGKHRIHLAFSDGTDAIVDFQRWLVGPVFEPLRNTAYFRRFFIESGTVVWPNGADIAPETLYEAAQSIQSKATIAPPALRKTKRRG